MFPKAGLEKIGAIVAGGVTTPRNLGSDIREKFNVGYAVAARRPISVSYEE